MAEKSASLIIKYKTVLIIAFLGLFLRLLALINTRYAGDNIVHWSAAGKIVNGSFTLLGPHVSLNSNFHLGPFYYYFLSIPYFLGRGDFRASIMFFCLLGALSTIFLYFALKNLLPKRQIVQTVILFSFSSYILQIQSFPWNPDILPFFVILILYAVSKVKENKFNYLTIAGFLFGASVQIHITAILLFPVYLYLLPKKIPIKYYVFSIVAFLVVSFPWFLAIYTDNFHDLTKTTSIITSSPNQSCAFGYWLANHGHGEYCFSQIRNTLFSFRMIALNIFGSENIVLVLVSSIAVLALFIKNAFLDRKLIVIWLFIPMFLYFFYKYNIYIHYFIYLIPLPFIMFSQFLLVIEKRFKIGIQISDLILIFIVVINILQYLFSLNFSRG